MSNLLRIRLAAATLATVLTLLCCAAVPAQGLTLYVALGGNDTWSGRMPAPNAAATDGPFASITQARDAVRQWKAANGGLKEPVTINIRGGTYYLPETITFTPEDSGTQQCPISYQAMTGERPVISGGKRIGGWQPHKGKIQVATLPDVPSGKWSFRSLFVDGRRQTRARYPNFDPSDPHRKGFLYAARDPDGFGLAVSGTTGGSRTEFHCAPGTFKPSWAASPEAEIHVFQSSSCRAFMEIVSLVKVDPKSRTVTIGGPECVTPIRPGDRYFVENVPEELDSPGEWYLDQRAGRLFYQPLTPLTGKTEVVAPVLGRLVQVLGDAAARKPVSRLVFSGLTFQETDYSPDDGCVGYGTGSDGVFYLQDAAECTIENCTFRNIGKYAVCLSGSRAHAIRGNDVACAGEGGILLRKTAGNTVVDNHIHDCGQVYKHIGGVVLEGEGTSDNLVAHNLIHDISRYGISLKNAGSRNRLEYNRVLYFPPGGKAPVIRGCASLAAWQERGFDRSSRVADPRFADLAHDNYVLKPDSPAFQLGFEPIDTRQVGLLRDRCRCPIRPAAADYGLVP